MTHDFEYKTPSGRPAPYPSMTDEELDDFEAWAASVHLGWSVWQGIFWVGLVAVVVLALMFL